MTSDQPETAADADMDLAVLDETRIAQLVELDDGTVGLLAELVGLFRVAAHDHLDELDEYVAGGDMVSAKRAAHAICGESASLGATRAERQARQVEELAAQGSPEKVASLVAVLRRSVDDSIMAMDEEIARRRCAVP